MSDLASTQRDMKGPGVPRLIELLSEMAGESVYLWYRPDSSGEKWRLWTGTPSGSGGGEWGSGSTPWDALNVAFVHMTEAIFDGRLTRG